MKKSWKNPVRPENQSRQSKTSPMLNQIHTGRTRVSRGLGILSQYSSGETGEHHEKPQTE
jgi:hypothetical protein